MTYSLPAAHYFWSDMATEADLNKMAGIETPVVRSRLSKEERATREQEFFAQLRKPLTPHERKVLSGRYYIKRFDLGAQVAWRAGASQRAGTVVAVVKRGKHPSRMGYPRLGLRGFWRDHESYVVEADGQFWWPRVGALEEIAGDEKTVRERAAAVGQPLARRDTKVGE